MRQPQIKLIVRCAAEVFSLGPREIVSSGRSRYMIDARMAAYLIANKLTRHSLPTIGRALGGRDHTTVLHGIRCASARMTTDAAFAGRVHAAIDKVNAAMLVPADPVAAARRVAADPLYADELTIDEINALAQRVLETAAA